MQIVSPKTNVLRPKEVYKTLIFQYYLRHMTWCIGPIHPYWNQMCTTFLISSSLTWVVPAHSRSIVFAFLESCMLKLLEHLSQKFLNVTTCSARTCKGFLCIRLRSHLGIEAMKMECHISVYIDRLVKRIWMSRTPSSQVHLTFRTRKTACSLQFFVYT